MSSSDLKSKTFPLCPCRESQWVDPEPVCSRVLGELLLKDILKWVFLFVCFWTLLGARDAQRGLESSWLCCDSPERSHRVACPAALLSPEPWGQPELSPQERVELQELHFPIRSALTHRGESAHPKERFPSVCGGQEQGKEGAGQVVGQMGVSRRFGHHSGDRLRTETALNFTWLPLKSLLFQTAREKSSSRYSADHLAALMYWDPSVLSPEYSPGNCGSLRMSPLSKDQVIGQQDRNAEKGVCVSR